MINSNENEIIVTSQLTIEIFGRCFMVFFLQTSHYRFSISWPRILPDGTTATVNPRGIQYYDNLIDALIDAGIVPMVTLYHWDLPQALMKNGGWQDEKTVDHFAEYARLCFTFFGDRVRIGYWNFFHILFTVAGNPCRTRNIDVCFTEELLFCR